MFARVCVKRPLPPCRNEDGQFIHPPNRIICTLCTINQYQSTWRPHTTSTAQIDQKSAFSISSKKKKIWVKWYSNKLKQFGSYQIARACHSGPNSRIHNHTVSLCHKTTLLIILWINNFKNQSDCQICRKPWKADLRPFYGVHILTCIIHLVELYSVYNIIYKISSNWRYNFIFIIGTERNTTPSK